MYISLNWLKKFVDIPKGFTPEDLGDKLTMATVEIEDIVCQNELLDKVVVGEIAEINDHPNADKLRLVTVSAGKSKYQIVCGGINLEKGMSVALAKIGAKVHRHGEEEVTELKPIKIRGEESEGMICTSEEIMIEHIISQNSPDEIADLTHLKAEHGVSLAEALKLDDIVFEVDNKSMTHRPDLWGHFGLARELAAILKVKFEDYKTKEIKAGKGKKLKVEIKDKEKCIRYMGVVVDGIKIGPSPEWLSRSLEAVGSRSINNIVDITNYVMLELGQPMHAFDWREIDGDKIVVETAKKDEKFITLDDVERKLDEDMLLIKDGKKAVALAGIMGGQNSEIKDDTTTLLFESANFKASNVRTTSTQLGLRSESSSRFEKGLDPLLAEQALQRAIELTLEIIPEAKVVSKVIDENHYEFKNPSIDLDLNWLSNRLGIKIKKEDVVSILERLKFGVKAKKDILEVTVPSWRATGDVSIPEDLVEEVSRIYGYDNIKPSMPDVPLDVPEINFERRYERRLKNIMTGNLAFMETYNYSFVNKAEVEYFGFEVENHIALKNYLSEDQSLLRTSLIPNLLKNVVDSQRFYSDFKIFELGRVFLKKEGEYDRAIGSKEQIPWQHKILSGVVVEKENSEPFYKAKGVVESLLDQLDLNYYFKEIDYSLPAWVETSRTLEIFVKGEAMGSVGEISNFTKSKLDIDGAVGYFELDFTKLAEAITDKKKYKEIPKYPAVLRDLAVLVGSETNWEDIKKEVKKAGGKLVEKIDLFDVYDGDKIESGKRSLAFHLEYWSAEKTLESAEVDELHKKIVKALEKKFNIKVR